MDHKTETSQNYRLIFELKKIDFCELAKFTADPRNKGLDHFINWFNETLGGFWIQCPWKVIKVNVCE